MMEEIILKGLERGWLLEPEAKEICQKYGIFVGKWKVIRGLEEIDDAIKDFVFPLVMKIVSPDVIHKSDVGGVILDINSRNEAYEAFKKIEKIAIDGGFRLEGVLIEEMAPKGLETIIGAKMDPQFGPVVVFGLGGIFTEIFNDISLRIAPIDKEEALKMISEIRGHRILKGVRGRKPSDIESLAEVILKVSNIIMDFPRISEIDLNPTIVYERGYRVVDARMIFSKR
ncbi:MAG: acetate--CoA ligase family protein [Candidatus Methanomethyliaceae archaeon]|nr:acetate--CoA ligase family protein [Candidatus Methanomethyliaceae archaeon]MDW7970811.1 acetate--CoA ligase family protein [Nitrososphaerota archaeon]